MYHQELWALDACLGASFCPWPLETSLRSEGLGLDSLRSGLGHPGGVFERSHFWMDMATGHTVKEPCRMSAPLWAGTFV